jgi:hypothetical protein
VDWNQDGELDILSGCYWSQDDSAGHIELLAGEGELRFAAATPLLTASGAPVRCQHPPEEEGDEEAAANNQETPLWNICTQQHAVDYDGDGDLDLVLGNFEGSFYYVQNEGTAAATVLSDTPVKLSIRNLAAHSAPHLVDWDNDGDLDLLSGTSNGGAFLSENVGSRTEPEWSKFKQLVGTPSSQQQTTDDGGMVSPSASTRVWATDWNGDGKWDLLVGDSVTISNRKADLSEATFKAKKQAYDEGMKKLMPKYSAAQTAYADAVKKGEPSEKLMAEVEKQSQKFGELYAMKAEFLDETMTGHVWLYLQQ